MKPSEKKAEEYASGIGKALRRAARRAVFTAAATGTRLVIYEEGRIKRVRPANRLGTANRSLGLHTPLSR
jgi:hypothetical protein